MKDIILIVTQDKKVIESIGQVFSSSEYTYFVCDSANKAVSKARENSAVVLAIVDSELSDSNGIDTLKRIQSVNEDCATIVILSEHDYDVAMEAGKMGIYDFITKPLSEDKIPIRIKVALEKRKKSIEDKIYQAALERRLSTRTQEVLVSREKIRNQFMNTIHALEKALQARHIYTEGHSRRVAQKSVELAKELNLSKEEIQNVEISALFHDIGKIGIRDTVLNKTSKLTESEYEHMKSHPQVAADILAPLEEFAPIINIIKHEHERFDGHGYPEGLKGEQIPIGARIIAVADTWDSLVYDRIYRKACSKEEALTEIQRYAGTQFDPLIVKIFIDMEARKLKKTQATPHD